MALPTIRVFISSPSDVRPERLRAEQIIARLDREFAYHFRVEALLWEREPLVADRHFQAEGNIPRPRGTDIVVVILWTRLGVPLPEDQFRGALSGRPVTGTEWESEDALAGARGSGRPDLLLYRKDVRLTADLGDRRLLEERLAQLDLVEGFVGRWFRSEDGQSYTAASHSFATSTEFEEKLYDHLRPLLQRHAGAAPHGGEIRWHGPPFRGLAPFGAEHAAVFFGRTAARNALRERLARADAQDRGFLLVLGASGSGKSSLVRAGLVPDLALPGMVGRVALVRQAAMRPCDRPGDLCGALAAALLSPSALPELLNLRYAPDRLADLLRSAPGQIALPVEQGLAAASRAAKLPEIAEARVLLLLLDQMEEMFTHGVDAGERDRFAAALDALCRTGAAWVVATMRSDFYDRLEAVPLLARMAEGDGCYRLLPPDAGELAQIVRGPAREAGLRFGFDEERGVALDDVVLDAAARDRDALPLLSFLLDQLWLRRSGGGELTVEAYRRLGGFEGALGRHAEGVVASCPEAERDALPRVLRSLVTLGSGLSAAVAARSAPLDRFPAGSPERALVEAFLQPAARLLAVSGDEGGAPRVRVAHEALLGHWPRARDWIAERPADLQLEDRIEAEAARWAGAAEADQPSLLRPPGLPLVEAQDILARRRDELSDAAARFVALSVAADAERRAGEERAREAREALRRQAAEAEAARLRSGTEAARRIAARTRIGLAVALVLALVASGLAWLSAERTGEARRAEAAASGRLREAQLRQSRFVAALAGQTLAAGRPDAAALMALAALPADLASPDHPYDPHAVTVVAEARSVDRALARLDHSAFVGDVALSPDGARIVIASRDGTAAVWIAATGALKVVLTGHRAEVRRAAFDPAGARVATASFDGTARIWDAGTGAVLAVLTGHGGQVESARFSPDGARVATASADGTARLWDAATGAPLHLLRGDGGAVNSALFSPDGGRLLTAGDDRTARLWDVATGEPGAVFRGHTGAVEVARFSLDGRRVLTASRDGTALLWNAASGAQLALYRRHTGTVTDADFSPDGSGVVTASADDTAVLWRAATGEPLAVFMGHTGAVSRAAFTPDGRRVVTAGGDGTGRIWTAAVEPVAVLAGGTRPAVEGGAWSPDGRRAAFGTQDGTVFVLDGTTGAVLHRLAGHADRVGRIAWSPDGRALATASNDGTARIWDADSGAQTALLQGHAKLVDAVAFTPDGRQVLTGSWDGTARLWDRATGAPRAVLSGHGGAVRSARFSPDGLRIATASADNTARVWDAGTGRSLAVLAGHGGPVDDAAFSPDGSRVATASEDGTARVWTASTGVQVLSVGRPGADAVVTAAWSPSGDRLLTSFRQSTSELWDAATGAPLRGFYGDAPVFSPDGLRVATALTPVLDRTVTAGDRKVTLFDAATGATLAEYLGHTSSLTGVAFSPDGSRLLSTAWDGTARFWPVWPLLTNDTVAYARISALRRLTPRERASLDLEPEPAAAPAGGAPPSEPAAACDALAGNPFDPARRGPGLAFADMDADRAVPACRRAAEADPGEPRLAYELGRALQRAGQFAAARDAMARAAAAGSAAGAYGLGVLLQAGLGGAADPSEALRLYRRADEAGMPDADFKVAQLHRAGAGVERDAAEALRWLERGASRGGPLRAERARAAVRKRRRRAARPRGRPARLRPGRPRGRGRARRGRPRRHAPTGGRGPRPRAGHGGPDRARGARRALSSVRTGWGRAPSSASATRTLP